MKLYFVLYKRCLVYCVTSNPELFIYPRQKSRIPPSQVTQPNKQSKLPKHPSSMAGNTGPALDIPRHLKYWKRCLRSLLPNAYQSNEGNRLALAYFIINSIAILTPKSSEKDEQPEQLLTPKERRALREWVLSHQHGQGGFCGTSSLTFPLHAYDEWNFETQKPEVEHSGLANIAATLFALQLLALLSDDDDVFRGVDRVKTLRWLRKLQREDGSFGEVLRQFPGRGWFIGGGSDMRYCYIATSIRWFLRGDVKEGEPGWVEDFDTEGLARYILNSQTYDGGFAASSQEEPHAGYAYCAIGALSLLSRPLTPQSNPSQSIPHLTSTIRSLPITIHWLASRQFIYLEKPPPSPDSPPGSEESEYEEDDDEETNANFLLVPPKSTLSIQDSLTNNADSNHPFYIGFNGRCNKRADTCYYWWVGGALSMLGLLPSPTSSSSTETCPKTTPMILTAPAREFLLQKMQHIIGGFGKTPGAPPDLYHSCFGLAILALMGDDGLSELDAALALPRDTVRRIEKSRDRLVERAKEEGQKGALGREMVDMGLELLVQGDGNGEIRKRPAWLTGVLG
ncbi:geranylgeranyl transferase type-2 subunit beta [Naviculisporaceae sp. PSN 640]